MADPTPAPRSPHDQNALGSAIEELAIWIEQRGSVDVAERIQRHLDMLVANSDFIAGALADLAAQAPGKGDHAQ
ncbi:hypothetical protein D9M68_222400 [compost metagenome]